MNKRKKFIIIIVIIGLIFWMLSWDLSGNDSNFKYGASFSRFHSDELKLDWKKTYLAILDDLKVKHLRLSAHWPLTEPKDGVYNFSELDFQMKEAEARNVSIILAVGRRLPGWPECHEPVWLPDYAENHKELEGGSESENELLFRYIEQVVNRYKNYPNLLYWQVENEPFLGFFGRSGCHSLKESELKEEIDLFKKLDPHHSILVTDSGEFGTWYNAYHSGDAFGTSMYLYVWWRNYLGPIRYPITPAFFRIKHSIIRLIYGTKPSMIIELSTEPWLLQPIIDTPIDIQLQRMGVDKFNEMINFSSKTGFDTFYLWGAEWWYWLSVHGHPEHWNRARELYKNSP